MGGVRHFATPKYVWSPSGGWWATPKLWKRNTAVIGCGILACTGMTWMLSASLEKRFPRWKGVAIGGEKEQH